MMGQNRPYELTWGDSLNLEFGAVDARGKLLVEGKEERCPHRENCGEDMLVFFAHNFLTETPL